MIDLLLHLLVLVFEGIQYILVDQTPRLLLQLLPVIFAKSIAVG